MKTLHRSRILLAAIPLAGIALAAVPAAAAAGPAAARPHTVHVSGRLTVAYTAPPVCTAGVCIINNQGTGTLAPYGPVTFTTVITADGADSTGIFAGARGQGSDTAYPQKNTAAPQGTLTLSP